MPISLPFTHAPQSLCVLRLSAVGDICHALPVVRSIQQQWPQTKITWIIGKLEATLVGDIDNIDFITFDKSKGLSAYREVRRQLHKRRFDALLHMQMSLRSSILNRFVNTNIRIGFDRARAKDLQWLFNNHTIAAQPQQHVLDSFFSFAEAIGVHNKQLIWDIPISSADRDAAEQLLPGDPPTLIISPCSSMAYRNWHSAGYAAVCDYAHEHYGLRVAITGGPSAIENQMASEIDAKARHKPINLVGKTNLKQLLALLYKAVAVVSPDSGPAHMATAVRTPVIGLYACTNPDRARPYLSAEYTIDKYHEAVLAKYGKNADELMWGLRVRDTGTMERITVEDVTGMLDKVITSRMQRS